MRKSMAVLCNWYSLDQCLFIKTVSANFPLLLIIYSFQGFVWLCTYPSTVLQIRLKIADNNSLHNSHFSWFYGYSKNVFCHNLKKSPSVPTELLGEWDSSVSLGLRRKKVLPEKNISGPTKLFLTCALSSLEYMTSYLC